MIRVQVESNSGGDILVGVVRERLADLDVVVVPVIRTRPRGTR